MGSPHPFERARFAEENSWDFASTGLDFPSLRLGFSFRRIWETKTFSHAIAQLPPAAQ
jgi:hypothetical protein